MHIGFEYYWNKKGHRQGILLPSRNISCRCPPAALSSAGYSTIGFSLFQYKGLLSRLCFSRALHSANCLTVFYYAITISITWWRRLCLILFITAPHFGQTAFATLLSSSYAWISSEQLGQYQFCIFRSYLVVFLTSFSYIIFSLPYFLHKYHELFSWLTD